MRRLPPSLAAAVAAATERRPPGGFDALSTRCSGQGSDLHLSVGNPPIMRVDGEIHFMKQHPMLGVNDVRDLMTEIT